MKFKKSIAAFGLAVCMLAQPVMAGQSKENCKTYRLSAGYDRATLAATNFTITNDGPESVVIETDGDQSFQEVIEPSNNSEVNGFAGDARFTYFVRLAKADGRSTITVCSHAGELEDAEAAYDRGDYATALQLLRPLAEQGDVGAETKLGYMYARGEGVTADDTESTKWFRQAAEQGDADAQNNLGIVYEDGYGVPQDYVEALRWYRKAADQGYAAAQINLGIMYEFGKGVPQDYTEAVMWYRKSAEQGYAAAQRSLGIMYANGQGVPKDYAESLKWVRKAVEQGFADAQFTLGYLYEKGFGVPRDNVQAFVYYYLAVKGGNDQAVDAVGYLHDEVLTPDQIAVGERQAQEWLAAHPQP